MWKLRTHLLTHSSPKKNPKRGDHEYAEAPLKKVPEPVIKVRKTVSDHPYANPADSTPAPATAQETDPEGTVPFTEGYYFIR